MSRLIRHFTDRPLPREILVETSFAVKLTNPRDPMRADCVAFLVELRHAGAVVVYSSLLRPELWDARLKMALVACFGRRWPIHLAHRPALAGAYHHRQAEADRLFRDYINQFDDFIEVPLLPDLLELALSLIPVHNLRSYDAIHLATARYLDVGDMLSFDHHFDHIPDIDVWMI